MKQHGNRKDFNNKGYTKFPYDRRSSRHKPREYYEAEQWNSPHPYNRQFSNFRTRRYQNNYSEQINDNIYSENYYRRINKEESELRENLLTNPKERKAKEFLQTVLKQPGVRSKLIFLETIDSAIQTLQGTVDNSQVQMTVDAVNDSNFVMKIDGEEIVQGIFSSKQIAKNSLAEQALELLKKDCFYIVKKKVYEEISTKVTKPVSEDIPQTSFAGSKAHQMMLKMGWSGKGLGVNEQGAQETLADTIDQNITRQGLGNSDVFKKVNKILEEYAGSTKITMLRFDPDFTSEERAHIHKIASKFGLKSKSEGKGSERRITVTKKLHRADLVFNLLVNDMENTLYKLIIPSNFAELWEMT